jgi:hypothetical protein
MAIGRKVDIALAPHEREVAGSFRRAGEGVDSEPTQYLSATHLQTGIVSDGPEVEVEVDDVAPVVSRGTLAASR